MTLAELCEAALQRSDNTAGNWLLRDHRRTAAVTDFARSSVTTAPGSTAGRPSSTRRYRAIRGTPARRVRSAPGYQRLLTGDAWRPAARPTRRWMRGNQTSSLRAGLPPRWTSADKTGSGDYGSTNDVGVVYGPDGRRAVLSIMTRSQSDDPKADALRPLIGELTALVLPYVIGG